MLSVGDLIDPIGFWLYIKRAPGQVVSWQKKKKKNSPFVCMRGGQLKVHALTILHSCAVCGKYFGLGISSRGPLHLTIKNI